MDPESCSSCKSMSGLNGGLSVTLYATVLRFGINTGSLLRTGTFGSIVLDREHGK